MAVSGVSNVRLSIGLWLGWRNPVDSLHSIPCTGMCLVVTRARNPRWEPGNGGPSPILANRGLVGRGQGTVPVPLRREEEEGDSESTGKMERHDAPGGGPTDSDRPGATQRSIQAGAHSPNSLEADPPRAPFKFGSNHALPNNGARVLVTIMMSGGRG
jgi:hypothetical protein